MNDLEAFLENLSLEGVVGPVSENRMVVPILSGIVGKVDIFSLFKTYFYLKELKTIGENIHWEWNSYIMFDVKREFLETQSE